MPVGRGEVSGDPEAQVAVTGSWPCEVPDGRPTAVRIMTPAPAVTDLRRCPLRAPGIDHRRVTVVIDQVPIPAPFPDIAMHVIKAESIGTLPLDGVCHSTRIGVVPGIPSKL